MYKVNHGKPYFHAQMYHYCTLFALACYQYLPIVNIVYQSYIISVLVAFHLSTSFHFFCLYFLHLTLFFHGFHTLYSGNLYFALFRLSCHMIRD